MEALVCTPCVDLGMRLWVCGPKRVSEGGRDYGSGAHELMKEGLPLPFFPGLQKRPEIQHNQGTQPSRTQTANLLLSFDGTECLLRAIHWHVQEVQEACPTFAAVGRDTALCTMLSLGLPSLRLTAQSIKLQYNAGTLLSSPPSLLIKLQYNAGTSLSPQPATSIELQGNAAAKICGQPRR